MFAQVRRAIELLRSEGVSEENPITPDTALRFRGIGPKTLPYLEELGLVRLDDFADLPTRMGNLLRIAGFKSREEVVAAIVSGSFVLKRKTCYCRSHPGEPLRSLRNCGPHIFHQIRAWAGFHATQAGDHSEP